MSSRLQKAAVGLLVGITLVGTVGEASAARNRYTRQTYAGRGYGYHGGYGYRHRGYGGGAAVAGAALGIVGLAAGAAAANSYYRGYPAYGPGYEGDSYGYDYQPGYGYYGPY